MVGLLGCGCCDSTPPAYCNNGYTSDFADDFSPDFEAGWDSTAGLVASAGTAQCNTTTSSPFGNYSEGRGILSMQKTSESGTVSVRVKLFAWPSSSTFGSINAYRARVGVYDLIDNNWVRVSAILIDQGSWFAFERTTANGNLTTIIPITPSVGDVFGLDVEGWAPVASPAGYIRNTSTKVILNGATIYTETGTLSIDPCDFDAEMYIKQPAIDLAGSYLVRLDDYTATAQ